MTYTQCTLVRNHVTTVAYIPSEFTVLNKVLQIKTEQGIWQDGYVVQHVGHTVTELPDSHQAIKEHMLNTGDKLRRVR